MNIGRGLSRRERGDDEGGRRVKKVFIFLILSFLLSGPTCSLAQETIISKSDADYIFTLKKAQWEEYIKQAIHPMGWKVKIHSLDTGSVMGAFDPKTGLGLTVQPLFRNNYSLPEMIIVGSWYPKGMVSITDELKCGIENESKKDLGPEYHISLNHKKEPEWDIIEILITKSQKK
jgi:hypothetical protein